MKLIIIPLLFLIVIASLSQMGLGTMETTATGNLNTGVIDAGFGESTGDDDAYYDDTGHLVQYFNGSLPAGGEPGRLEIGNAGSPHYRTWYNGSNHLGYILQGVDTSVSFERLDVDTGYALGGSLGLIAVVVAIMVIATVAGIRFLGIGESEFSISTIVKGSFFLTLWGIFSIMAMDIIVGVPYFGSGFYFILTVLYTLGMINSFGSSGSDL